jgi:MYXO-CTERM domain-containing protein
MKKTKFSTLVAASLLALSVLLLPISTSTFAQTTAPTPEASRVETNDTDDNAGLWGLLGLVGLLGLAGLRRPDRARVYTDPRERSRV